MRSTVNLVLRDAQPVDRSAIVRCLTAAFAGGTVARWLDPNDATRTPYCLGYFEMAVDDAAANGAVRVAVADDVIVGAALWVRYPAPDRGDTAQVSALIGEARDPGDPARAVLYRYQSLDRLLQQRHPRERHDYLAFLGVHPDRQNQGIGSALLIGGHAYLHTTGTPAYLEASDPRNRVLYLRHGYHDLGAPIRLPHGPQLWPMWRDPIPADLQA